MSAKRGQFIFSAIIVVGCLVVGIALGAFVDYAPAVMVAVVTACALAMLVYAFLGGISEAGFNFGPVKMTGSAAVLLGSAWWINTALEPQLEQIRDERRIEQFSFDFDEHAAPADGWFAVDERTAVPVAVEFTDPVTERTAEVVTPPSAPNLPLKLVPEPNNENYLVMGTGTETGPGLGYVSAPDLVSAVGAIGLQPGTGYGFQRLISPRMANCRTGWCGGGATPPAAARACRLKSRPCGSMDSPTTTSGGATPRKVLRRITHQVLPVATASW